MTGTLVTDASSLLAIAQDEPGGANASAAMRSADVVLVSAVNVAEVVAKLVDGGLTDDQIRVSLERLDVLTVPFDSDAAILSGLLRRQTRSRGISLGDRACLATAQLFEAAVLTADRAWATLGLDVDVVLIR